MYDWHDSWGLGTWITMALLMLVFWGLIAALIVYVIRSGRDRPMSGPNSSGPPEDQAQRILDERFALGEIDADEYKGRRELLRGR
jgi:putative membrane protein